LIINKTAVKLLKVAAPFGGHFLQLYHYFDPFRGLLLPVEGEKYYLRGF
jgi:hypothetical protein